MGFTCTVFLFVYFKCFVRVERILELGYNEIDLFLQNFIDKE